MSVLQTVYQVATVEELEALPSTLVLQRFLTVKHARTHPDERGGPRYEILGEIEEGADLVHVVFRKPDPFNRQPPGMSVDVLTLRLTEHGWRALLNGGLVYDSDGGYSIGILGPVADDQSPAT